MWLLHTIMGIIMIQRIEIMVQAQSAQLEISSITNPAEKYMPEISAEEPQQVERDEEIDDVDTSPSEIVESYVLLGQDDKDPTSHILHDQDDTDPTITAKRPRKKRRRRRRKRPKIISIEDQESVPYFVSPVEESKAYKVDSSYHQQPDIVIEEIHHEPENVYRRRPGKRRRRPLKRPLTDDYSTSDVEIVTHSPNRQLTDEKMDENKIKENSNDPNSPSERLVVHDDHKNIETKTTSESPTTKIEIQFDMMEKELEERFNNLPINMKRRRKPDIQPINTDSVQKEIIVKLDSTGLNSMKHNNSMKPNKPTFSVTSKPDIHLYPEITTHRNIIKGFSNKKIPQVPIGRLNEKTNQTKQNNIENETFIASNTQPVIEEELIQNQKKIENGRKDTAFLKLRRLPPTSAILKHFKNKTQTDTRLIENSTENVVVSTYDINIVKTENVTTASSEHNVTNINDYEDKNTTTTNTYMPELSEDLEQNFEFPIITYTGQKSTQLTESPIKQDNIEKAVSKTYNFTKLCDLLAKAELQDGILSDAQDYQFVLSDQDIVKLLNYYRPVTTTQKVEPKELMKSQQKTANEILAILKTKSGSARLGKILQMRNMTLDELIQYREQNNHTTVNDSDKEVSPENTMNKEITNISHNSRNSTDIKNRPNVVQEVLESVVNDTNGDHLLRNTLREPKHYNNIPLVSPVQEKKVSSLWNIFGNSEDNKSPIVGTSQEIILSYTSTENPTSTLDAIDQDILLFHETDDMSHFRNNILQRKTIIESSRQRDKDYQERRKLPIGVKSAIIISGAILALAVLGFFALLLSCKIRQKKSRLRRQQDILCKHYQNRDIRQSSRSTSPVVKRKFNNERIYTTNGMQPNMESNRHYYLWKTLRRTFQYD